MDNWLNINLFRAGCWFCHAPRSDASPLCPDCQALLPHNHSACPRCALPVAQPGTLCGACLAQPPVYSQSRIPFVYARPIDRLITGLKFQQHFHQARLLGELLAPQLPVTFIQELDALLPVPLHPRRLRERGYNQALEISRFIARRHELPLLGDICRRVRATAAQSALPLKQRKHNLRQAFDCSEDLDGLRLGIVDDVVTSGHTVNELARCLQRAGAESISVIAVARADFPG